MTLQLGDTAPDFEADTTDGTLHVREVGLPDEGVLFLPPLFFPPFEDFVLFVTALS